MSEPVVSCRGLTKHYGAAVGLEGLDLAVEAGEVVGFLGPNGAGKTTTIRLALDLIRPTAGTVRLFGRDPSDPKTRARVGYLPGDLHLDNRLTGARMLAMLDALRPHGSRPVDPARQTELCERLALSPADLARVIRADSKGTRQKIGLVAAFQHDPELLVLDEPTSGLDPLVREAVFELMDEARDAGRTVFHSSHILSEVDRTCTRVGVLRAGRLVALETTETLRRGLSRRVTVRFRDGAPVQELAALSETTIAEHDGLRVVLHVGGDLRPLLALLAKHALDDLVAPEPDLDEVFHTLYRGAGERETR